MFSKRFSNTGDCATDTPCPGLNPGTTNPINARALSAVLLAGVLAGSISACGSGADVGQSQAILPAINNDSAPDDNLPPEFPVNANPAQTELFASYDGRLVEFTPNRDGTFDIYVRGLDRELTRYLIDSNGNSLLTEPRWGRLHDTDGTRTQDYLYVLSSRDNPALRSNCRITAYRDGTSVPYWTVAMPTDRHQCSMESSDSEQNYYFARDNKLVSLTPDGYLRFEVEQPLAPAGGQLMNLAGAMVLVEMGSNAQPALWVYSPENGGLIYSATYLGNRMPFGSIDHVFAGANDTFYAAGETADNNNVELQRINAFNPGAQSIRTFSRASDPGIRTARFMNNEVVAVKDAIVTIINSQTLETVNVITIEGSLLGITDQHVYALHEQTNGPRAHVVRYRR